MILNLKKKKKVKRVDVRGVKVVNSGTDRFEGLSAAGRDGRTCGAVQEHRGKNSIKFFTRLTVTSRVQVSYPALLLERTGLFFIKLGLRDRKRPPPHTCSVPSPFGCRRPLRVVSYLQIPSKLLVCPLLLQASVAAVEDFCHHCKTKAPNCSVPFHCGWGSFGKPKPSSPQLDWVEYVAHSRPLTAGDHRQVLTVG